jgi:hypothetical protein
LNHAYDQYNFIDPEFTSCALGINIHIPECNVMDLTDACMGTNQTAKKVLENTTDGSRMPISFLEEEWEGKGCRINQD